MKMKSLKVALGVILASGTLVSASGMPLYGTRTANAAEQSAIAAVTAKPTVYVAPIDRAKFLAGSLFDFRVELNDLAGDPGSVSITVNGKDAETFFGKPFVKTSTDTSREFTIREVTFKQAGSYTVSVKSNALSKSVKYEVVNADPVGKKAKNVILFVGDGMAFSSVTMARIMSKGMTEGKYNDLLELDKFDQRAIVTTSGMDSLVTDSANSASAYNTGHKSAVNGLGIYPDNTEDSFDDPKVETLAEMLKRARGMSIGVVTTSEIEDATPAAVVSHTRRRSDKPEIAEMLYRLQPEVVLGGGSAYFLPKSVPGSKRKDEKDLISDFQKAGYTFAENAKDLIAAGTPKKLLGLFHTGDMNVYYDRSTNNTEALKTFTDQPNLWDMTQKAIDVLSQNENGFFLMVEGASVDKQLHAMDWERSAYDEIELDKAIGVARKFAEKSGDTLIIATADHSHSASIAGTYWEGDGKTGRDAVRTYESAGFPTYVDANKDGFPDSPDPDRKLAIVFGATPDYYEDYKFNKVPQAPAVNSDGKYVANPATLSNPDAANKDQYWHSGTLPYSESTEVHTADDVPLMAYGPGSSYFKGTLDNTEVFFGIVNSLGLSLNGAKPDGKTWVSLTDFLNVIGGTATYDKATNSTTVKANGKTLVLNLSKGTATKNGKSVKLEYKVSMNKTIVTSQSLLAALGQ